jgi:hypothetical protein
MMARTCIVICDHRNDMYLQDLVDGIERFCTRSDIAWYNSCGMRPLPGSAGMLLTMLPQSRPLDYAKVTPFFLDMFEWAAGQSYDFIVNAETDMAFVQSGYERFIAEAMSEADHLAPGYARNVPRTSRWRPYRSLRGKLPELLAILGATNVHRCFSPGQVFSARYIGKLVTSTWYTDLRDFVSRNQQPDRSFSFQEVLLPTVGDVLGLRSADYPAHLASVNRYRPYHASASILRARETRDAYFVHPVRRDEADGARQIVRQLARQGSLTQEPQ